MVSIHDTDKRTPVQELRQMEAATEDPVERGTRGDGNRFRIRDLFVDERCTRSILNFLRATEVGARAGPRELPPGLTEAEEGLEGE